MTTCLRVGAIAIAASLVCIPIASAHAQAPDRAEILVAAAGVVTYVPDRASVMLEVRTDAPTPQEAAAKNATEMQRLLARLRALGFSSQRMSTVSFAVAPNLRYESGTQTLVGYVANNTVTLRFDSIAAIGRTVDAALAAGATGIRTVRFEVSDYATLRREALQRAVAAARRDAEALASAAGGTLGDLLQLTTDPRVTQIEGSIQSIAAAASRSGPVETAVSAGEQSLSALVQTRWVLITR